ncbi:MAG: hypothetical protein CYG60_09770 [Actinobacteria bacterium]|nr:hypothetical protein [Actinomycetota bacterium]PLS85967.1 MAG: hypothetical protein CYG60_09770 [Actinomycetota bacterium]
MIGWVRCPRCSSRSTAKVVYGDASPSVRELAEAGYVHLGGNRGTTGGGRPDRFCNDCANEWETASSMVRRTFGIPSF